MTIKKIKDSSGIEHAIDYNALENKPTYWAGWILLLPNTTKLEKQSTVEIDMTSHLPDDGHVYSCAIQVRFGCSGSSIGLYASSDLTIDDTATSYLIYRGLGNSSTLGGSCQVFVGPGRKLYLHNSSADEYTSVHTIMTNYFRVS